MVKKIAASNKGNFSLSLKQSQTLNREMLYCNTMQLTNPVPQEVTEAKDFTQIPEENSYSNT